jgi:hypothetical protein
MIGHVAALILLLFLSGTAETPSSVSQPPAGPLVLRGADVESWLDAFAEKAPRDGAPSGAALGEWLEAAALSGDPELRERGLLVVARLALLQKPDGYLGTTDPAARNERQPIRADEAPEMYATLSGLITAAGEWSDPTARAVAAKLADYLLARIAPGKAEFWVLPGDESIAGPAEQLGLHATMLAGPVARLGTPKCLAWSRWVVQSLDRWSGRDLVASLARGDAPPGVPYAILHRNLLVFLELGDAMLTRTARKVWGTLARSQASLTDTESVASWLRLSQALLEATGDAACAEAVEWALWNRLLPAQAKEGWYTSVPLSGVRKDDPRTDVLAGETALTIARRGAVIVTEDGAALCQYAPVAAEVTLPSGNRLTIGQRTDYPSDGDVHVSVTLARPERFVLRIRIPGWCTEPRATVNGEPVADLEPGEFGLIDRTWRSGDRLELSFPMEPRWLSRDGRYALARGPLVYALDTAWCDPVNRRRLATVAAVATEPPIRMATPAGALGPAYVVRVSLRDGARALAPMLPLANAGKAPATPDDSCTVWMPEATTGRFRPLDLRHAMNVHGADGRGLFTTVLATEESFPFTSFGAHTLGGVPFDVVDPATNAGRGLLVLRGGEGRDLATRYPTRAVVSVGMRCRALHILGGVAGWGHPVRKGAGRWGDLTVRIHYENARTDEVRLRNGEHLADYSTRVDVPGSQHALDLGGKQLRTLRIPVNPSSPVTEIEFLDNGTPLAPVIAAVTPELP